MVVKFTDYISRLDKPYASFFKIAITFINEHLLYGILIALILAIFFSRKRIVSEYVISGNRGKIVFDYCPVNYSRGIRVIEMPTSFTVKSELFTQKCDARCFLDDFNKYNKTNNLKDLIIQQLRKNHFTPTKKYRGTKGNEYGLGCIANIDYHSYRFLLTSSYKFDQSNHYIFEKDDDNTFLSSFFKNLFDLQLKDDVICIPVFSANGNKKGQTNATIYKILQIYIASVKGLGTICKELKICIQDDSVDDFDLFVSMSNIIDSYVNGSKNDSAPVGESIDV